MNAERSIRLAALALLVLCAGAAWLDAHTPAARALRARAPFWGLVTLRYEGQPEVIPPALYIILHNPHRHTLDIVLIPAGTPAAAKDQKPRTLADAYGDSLRAGADQDAAGRAMADAAAAAIPSAPGWPATAGTPLFKTTAALGASARPAAPSETRRRLADAAMDPFLWLRAPALWTRLAGTAGQLGAWDAAALLGALRALPPEAVRASRWPAPEMAGPFVAWLFEGLAKGDARGVSTISVLNAGAAPGVALKATKVLRWAGFDVVHFGNAPATLAETAAVDHVGRPEAAGAALAALGCRRAETLTALEAGPLTMASVSIGRDWDACSRLAGVGRTAEEGEGNGTGRNP